MPALYRIHEPPDPLKVLEFDEFVTSLGFSLGAQGGTLRPAHFQHLVDKIRGHAGGAPHRVSHAPDDAEGAI